MYVSAHLKPLRPGQQFELAQERSGYELNGCTRLDLRTDTGGRLVSAGIPLVVRETEWTLCTLGSHHPSFYRVIAGPAREPDVWLNQAVSQALWQTNNPNRDEPVEDLTVVGNVRWPDPSSESLKWAVWSIRQESHRRNLLPVTNRDVLAIKNFRQPLAIGIQTALGILRAWKVSKPEEALRERGFCV